MNHSQMAELKQRDGIGQRKVEMERIAANGGCAHPVYFRMLQLLLTMTEVSHPMGAHAPFLTGLSAPQCGLICNNSYRRKIWISKTSKASILDH